jgi:uncharacterized protein
MPDNLAPAPSATPRTFHVMAKPIGPICNLDCKYCFYLEKERLYPEKINASDFRMTDDVLRNYVRQHIGQQNVPEITFAWQGGEPTLMGLDFFRRAVELQAEYCPPTQRIANALQTNGLLLDDAWCDFFRRENFLIGLSIDGPKEIHDAYRVNKAGHGTHDAVMRAWGLLKKHGVQYNTLTVVNRLVGDHPTEVYEFLKDNGSAFMQFIPLVERVGAEPHALAGPPLLKVLAPYAEVAPWSVLPDQFGNFICEIFDRWVRRDVGTIFVQLFDVQLGIEVGAGSSLCVFAETCGRAMALEHNGDLYSCDHFVYPDFKLGNIMDQTIDHMVHSPAQKQFGDDKRDALPQYCQRCEVKKYCNGECPKHRFLTTPDGEPGLNYLCAGYKKIFTHMQPYLRIMADLLRRGRPAADLMSLGLDDPCPCGSGMKFKRCCGRNGVGRGQGVTGTSPTSIKPAM